MGVTKFSVFLRRVSLLNLADRTNFVAFPLERTGKSLEVQFDFGPRPGFSKQLFGSSREGTKLDWTCFKRFLWTYLIWAAANGGVTNGGLRGVWLPFLEIGRNRPFSPFFCLFRPFPEGAKSTWDPENEGKGPFSSDILRLLEPPSLKPPFAAS